MSYSFILQQSSEVLTSIIIDHKQTSDEEPTRWILYPPKNVHKPERIVRLFAERTGKVGWVTVSFYGTHRRAGQSYRFYVSRSASIDLTPLP